MDNKIVETEADESWKWATILNASMDSYSSSKKEVNIT